MEKLKGILESIIRIFLIVLIIGITIVNLVDLKINISLLFFVMLLLFLGAISLMLLYHKKIIGPKIFWSIIVTYFIIGIIIRIYFIISLDFNLSSDFAYFFENAKLIANGTIKNADNYYLSYNSYTYVLSWLIAGLFNLFGESIRVILYANLLCQILSSYFLYKIINIKYSKETSALLATVFFLLPTMICANLLVATESPFILMFLITIYYMYKIIDKKKLKPLNIILFIILGLLICLSNFIRPVMTIFIIALIIYYILKINKLKEIILLIITLFSYQLCNYGLNYLIEANINTETRSGALGWSIYFGTNYNTCGTWSVEDSNYVFQILDDETKGNKDLTILALNRLKDYGIPKTTYLMMCKYNKLWSDNVGTYNFVNDIININKSKINFSQYENSFKDISRIIVLVLCIITIISLIYEQRSKKENWLFVELFALGYILANLLICLNGRYNLPLYPLMLICCSTVISKLLIPTKQVKENSMNKYLKKLYTKDKNSYFKVLSNDLKNKHKRFIITVNPETLMMSESDSELKTILDGNYSFVPDGIAVVKAARKIGINVTERITGIDIAEYLLKLANENKYSIYLFGAKEEVIESLVEKIKKEYPNINILGYSNGYVKDKDKVMKNIIKKSPDICMVALGIPNQEKIIAKYFNKVNNGIYIGVGGSFDVMSGTKKRAPRIFIKLNLEWLYRIITEPSRLKRFWNSNVKFMFKIKK